ncbi:MAG: hypothetical protein QXQ68_07395 [Candidatus Nitrosocaldaceae archaeon]
MVEQIFWLQKKILEHSKDYDTLNIIFDLLVSLTSYIIGRDASKEISKPLIERNVSNEIKCEKLLKSVLELNNRLNILLSEWIEEKRKKAFLQGI